MIRLGTWEVAIVQDVDVPDLAEDRGETGLIAGVPFALDVGLAQLAERFCGVSALPPLARRGSGLGGRDARGGAAFGEVVIFMDAGAGRRLGAAVELDEFFAHEVA